MRKLIVLSAVAAVLTLAAVLPVSFTFPLAPGSDVTITGCTTQLVAQLPKVTCVASKPTPTPTNTPAPTPTPPPVGSGWHAPATHDGLNVHEHGHQPPSWVTSSAWPPFNQSRESHTGYKGVLITQAQNGQAVQLYFISHILATNMARSHGDHDYQLWYRSPTGQVFYRAGLLEFNAQNILSPIPTRTSDDGTRPVALSQGDGGCETWYGIGRVGGTANTSNGAIGWTICGRYERFSGGPTGEIGTFRSMDWVVQQSELPPELQQYASTEFGVTRLSWVSSSIQFPDQGVVPIN